MKKLSFQQKIENIIVTRGKEGALIYSRKDKKFNSCVAFAYTAVDKIGAGDALLSIISLCLKSGFSSELSIMIASLAGAHSVMTIGNKDSISKKKILKSLEALLK